MRCYLYVVALVVAGACRVVETVDPVFVEASSESQFDRLKDLVGTWKGTANADGEPFPVEVHYRLTGANSALEELLFPGTEHEMLSVYHRDGPWLLMTHYCAAGNQPRMRAVHTHPSPDPHQRIQFEFLDATNLASPNDQHMREVLFDFISRDHMIATWTSYEGGKPGEVARFDVQRVDS